MPLLLFPPAHVWERFQLRQMQRNTEEATDPTERFPERLAVLRSILPFEPEFNRHNHCFDYWRCLGPSHSPWPEFVSDDDPAAQHSPPIHAALVNHWCFDLEAINVRHTETGERGTLYRHVAVPSDWPDYPVIFRPERPALFSDEMDEYVQQTRSDWYHWWYQVHNRFSEALSGAIPLCCFPDTTHTSQPLIDIPQIQNAREEASHQNRKNLVIAQRKFRVAQGGDVGVPPGAAAR